MDQRPAAVNAAAIRAGRRADRIRRLCGWGSVSHRRALISGWLWSVAWDRPQAFRKSLGARRLDPSHANSAEQGPAIWSHDTRVGQRVPPNDNSAAQSTGSQVSAAISRVGYRGWPRLGGTLPGRRSRSRLTKIAGSRSLASRPSAPGRRNRQPGPPASLAARRDGITRDLSQSHTARP